MGRDARAPGKITYDLINFCRLVRYRKFIIKHQNIMLPLISEWRERYEYMKLCENAISNVLGEEYVLK